MLEFINITVKNAIVASAWGSIAGFVFLALPRSFLHKIAQKYRCFRFEDDGNFYDRCFKISKWKDKMPQFSAIMHRGFSMETVERFSADYLDLFIDETVRSELCHLFLVLSSPVFIAFNDTKGWRIFMVSAFIVGNLLFIMIQRYNRPRLMRVKRMYERRQNKKTQQRIDE